jgi:hypothetical protein
MEVSCLTNIAGCFTGAHPKCIAHAASAAGKAHLGRVLPKASIAVITAAATTAPAA